jgi:glutamine synthetase
MTTTTTSTATPDLATLAADAGTKFILALFVDLRGKPCAKLVPVEAIDLLATDGVGFAGYAVGAMGQEPKDPDLIAIPDPSSFTPIPFIKDGLAIVHCDPHVEGKPWPYAPRIILKSLIQRAADAGFEPWVGAEVEYFLLTRNPDGSLATADADDTAAQPCYDARGVTRMYDHLTTISSAMNQLGWSNYANDHEDGNGQFEQNFQFADALTTADRVVTLRYLLSMIAAERGMIATFMPKPFTDRTGTGLHLHLSLTSGGTPVFPSGDDEDDKGLGLSPTAYSFIAGILDHACALQAIVGPTVNSYKRTGAVTTASGASWAPRQATYGGNDRTHYIRVPDDQRVELRGGDGSANPYLAVAAAPEGRPTLPPTLLHAVDQLEEDAVVAGVLDAVGDGVAGYFAAIKRDEFFAYHSSVSPWEVEQYLTAF